MTSKIPLKLYNTLGRKKQIFKPIKKGRVGLYTCGITAYSYAHLGNLRTYIFEDVLKRVLKYNGYKVKHVMNITDVGHLTSQADTGEDKIELAARKEKKSAWEIARFYEKAFKEDLKNLNILEPDIWIRATETIQDQINLIKDLEKKGFTYEIDDGIYFDSSKLKTYGRLWPKKMEIRPGARVEMVPGKKNPTDFALWKFTPSGQKREMEWSSPWKKGFPGWHTECVAMSIKTLGIPFDIHCGGVDHILIHHTNEIAQAEALYGKVLARWWLHGEFLMVEGEKMAKSKGNLFTLRDIKKHGFDPLSFRYLCLQNHYRSKLNFTWRGLQGAKNSLQKLYETILELKSKDKEEKLRPEISKKYQEKFLKFINDDLNIPRALALTWNLICNQKISKEEKLKNLFLFDKILGFNLREIKKPKIPKKIIKLIKQREELRKKLQWKKADEIRKKIEKMGYKIEDTKKGPKIKKIKI